MTLLVSGWVAFDEIETPFAKRELMLGGSATPAALAASLFTDVRLLAAVGEDMPDSMLEQLDRPGIDLSGVAVIRGGVTSRWGGRYHYDMNVRDTIYTELGVNAEWQAAIPAGWDDSTTLFCAADHPVVQRSLIASLPAARASMVDTIKFYMDTARDDVLETFRHATFVAINETEARELSGVPGISKAMSSLLQNGPRGLIVKLGEYGAAFRSADDYFVAPGYPLEEVVDPTGAGDAFAGGFMGYLDSAGEIDNGAIRRAIIYASAVASFQVEGFGPERLLSLTREELDGRFAEFQRLTYFGRGD